MVEVQTQVRVASGVEAIVVKAADRVEPLDSECNRGVGDEGVGVSRLGSRGLGVWGRRSWGFGVGGVGDGGESWGQGD